MKICDHKIYNPNCRYCADVVSNFSYAIRAGYTVDESLDPTRKKDWKILKEYYEKTTSYIPEKD